ncbi:hypothetical protein [Pseudomonas mandelii]|uniref:Uncharacterized protein n=1 Tax=Pseudomonas mandelii TaxID=75612 RepID=A0ABY0VAQ3_9PSED|nr:hypothetical protein [Pseudomonas mandelii]TWS03923.1 hypothetical protein FJD35_30420 [Pseudomonas mandelii]SDU03915.1 hypothetical protein SAMN04489801_0477 [Pseudomonas mandelii]
MTAFKTPSAAQLAALASLSDADLMAPLTFDGAVPVPALVLAPVPAERSGGVPEVPALEALLAQARKVQDISVAADLPARTARISGVPANETVSPIMRATGGRLSEALRTAAGEHIKSADDLEYALRVFAAHALNSLLLNRRSDLALRERTAAEAIHTDWQDRLRVAAVGELAAIDAGQHLSSEEFQFLLELVDTGRAGMAQNLAGPAVNVPALVAGRTQDWRVIAGEWADACQSRGTVAFEGPGTATAGCSYNVEVQPGLGWVLSKYVGQSWVPVEACSAGQDRAVAERRRIARDCASAARPAPVIGAGFADKLRGLV